MSKTTEAVQIEPQEPTDLPANTHSSSSQDMTLAPPDLSEPPVIGSLVLSRLEKERRPKVSTVCEFCPASVWMASPKEVKCYCRIMHVISWISSEPNPLTDCDGLLIASQQ
jgi:hypothetical protein